METAFSLGRGRGAGSLVARAKVGRFGQGALSRKGRWEGRWPGRPCGHAATSSSSSSSMTCPSPVHRQSGGLSCCATASCSHSANCLEYRRNSPGAVLGLGC